MPRRIQSHKTSRRLRHDTCSVMERRKLNLKAKLETSQSYFSVKSLNPGALNVGSIGSTCTALP
jgi:hypothetical protein